MTATPKMEMKPTAAEMLKFVCVRIKAQKPPQPDRHHAGEDQQHVDQRTKHAVEQHEDQAAGQRDDDLQLRLGLLHVLEFAAPLEPVGGWNQAGGFLPSLGHGAGQVAAADVELDGDQPPALFAIDIRGAELREAALRIGLPLAIAGSHQVDDAATRELRQVVHGGHSDALPVMGRHMDARAQWRRPTRGAGDGRGADTRRSRVDDQVVADLDGDVENGRFVGAESLGPAKGDVEAPLALDHLADGPSADRRADHVLQIAHAHAPQRAFVPVGREDEVCLAENAVDADVFDAGNRAEGLANLLGKRFQLLAGRGR